MKAVVYHGIGDIRLDDVKEPKLHEATDAIVRLTASAICGTDLHMIRGTMPGMKPGTILGHEGIGIVEEIGKDVRNLRKGDRVVVPSTIDGMQAEYVRVPYAHVNLVKLPDEVTDDQAILLSDIFPTGYMGADMAEIDEGDTVAVFGCGPVGQFAIASAMLLGAGRVLAVDHHPSRLDMARMQGAEVINFDEEDPVETIQRLTGKIGVDRAIDAVGIDAEHAHSGPAAKEAKKQAAELEKEQKEIAPKQNPDGNLWQPGDAPSQVLQWSVQALAKAGTLSIIGVYPQQAKTFPIGAAMNKNLTIQMGNCHHRKYIPRILPIVQSGIFDPARILTQATPLASVIEAYERFDQREEGWIKVMLKPEAA
jgi:threonine dehydrogenase-like Zn-dependent dehydrogenase